MRGIPSVLLSKTSTAERRVFDTLRRVDRDAPWVFLHSLNCSEHAYKHWAEIDFLVAGPDGILVLEVKGGRIRRHEGVWIYTDRFGREHRSSEGPFEQARSAMYALTGLLEKRYRFDPVRDGRARIGFGVVFPDIDWDIDTPETPLAVVADCLAAADSRLFNAYLGRLFRYWSEKFPRKSVLSPPELDDLSSRLRPDIDLYPHLSLGLTDALREQQRLTDEQYERLDSIEANDRVIVSGGAGTGKTHLMMQCARRARAAGKRVEIVVHSPVLAAHLERGDAALSIHDRRAFEGMTSVADVVMVDEGQDLLDFDFLNCVSERVVGGLDEGRWRWFMDPNNQARVTGHFDPEALAYLERGLASGKPAQFVLRRNCRNTRQIVEKAELWTHATIGRTDVDGVGLAPRVVEYSDDSDLAMKLEIAFDELAGEDINWGEIGVVIPNQRGRGFLNALPRRIRSRLLPLDANTIRGEWGTKVLWGDVAAFKGLERPVILAAGFDSASFGSNRAGELYVASTRGRYGLWIFAAPEMAQAIQRAEEQAAGDKRESTS